MGAGLGLTSLHRRGHDMANKFRVVKSAYKTYKSAQMEETKEKEKKNENVDTGDGAEEKKKDEVEEMVDRMPVIGMIETLWNLSVIDIEGTLRSACHKLDKDSSVSKEVRVQRARGLLEMGKIFDAKGVEAEEGLKEIGSQLMAEMEVSRNREEYLKEQEQNEQNEQNGQNGQNVGANE